MVAGRPEKQVDWDIVDKLIEAQSPAVEIAGYFDMHVSNFYKKINEKYNTNFENYALSKYSKGKNSLRLKQYQMAMAGNVKLLERLGDVHLEQRDKSESKQNINVYINGDLASGIGIQAPKLPSSNNNSTE